MATILAHITIKPGQEAVFEASAKRLYAGTHEPGAEPAMRRYEYWRGQEDRKYYTLLAFDDYLGFLAHQTSPHHEGEIGPLTDSIETITLEWLDPIQGAAPLTVTAPQALPVDASDLAKTYADMFPAQVATWWAAQRKNG
jgi:phytoene dehydrogenase-like protein